MEGLISLVVLVIIAIIFEIRERNKISDYAKRKENFQRYHDKSKTFWWER